MSSSGSSRDHDGFQHAEYSTDGKQYTATDAKHPSEFLEFATVSPAAGGAPRMQFRPPAFEEMKMGPETQSGPEVNFTHSSDDLYSGMSQAIPNLRRMSVEARAAAKSERKMNFWTGVQTYPTAIMWSFILSMTIVMEGFDLTLINSFFAFPVFRKAYGTAIHPNAPPHEGLRNFQITPAWQSGLTNAANAAEVVGLFFNGYLTDRYGYHKTMVGTLIWMCLFVFLAFFAFNIEMLLASQVLCGLPWGIFQTLSTTYAAEVMPVVLRSYLTSNVNMCWLVGQLLGVGIVRGLVHNQSEWAYRIPFAIQWAFAVPILIAVLFAPEVWHSTPETWCNTDNAIESLVAGATREARRSKAGPFETDIQVGALRW